MADTKVKYNKSLREKARRIFGSEENYEIFLTLNQQEHRLYGEAPWKEYHQPLFEFEEDYLEANKDDAPFWMKSPFFLALLPLGSLGIPEGFESDIEDQSRREYTVDDWSSIRKRWRLDRLPRRDGEANHANKRDYSSLGWSPNDGDPVRLTSPEEHEEILRRLKRAGLEKAGSPMPVQGWTLTQLMAMDLPEPGWIVKDFLREGGAAMIHGPSGVGKTLLTATTMLLIATGNRAMLRDADGSVLIEAGNHTGKKVCLVDGEMVAADIVNRLAFLTDGLSIRPVAGNLTATPINPDDFSAAMAAQEEIEKDIAVANPDLSHEIGSDAEGLEAAKACIQTAWDNREVKSKVVSEYAEGLTVNTDNILIYPKTAQDYRASFISLIDTMDKGQIVEFAKREKIDVFVWDNLSTLCENLSDENSAAAFEPLNALIVALKNEGVASLVVHHAGKSGKKYRGSSNIETTLETVLQLSRVEGANEGARFAVEVTKNRNQGKLGIDGKTLMLQDGKWMTQEDPFANTQKVVDALKSLRYRTQEELGKALGIHQTTVGRAIKTAVAQGSLKPKDVLECWQKAKELAEEPLVALDL